MVKRIITASVAMLLCMLIVCNSAAAVNSGSDALGVDRIDISFQCGVLEGKSVQLNATLNPENALMSSVEWSSSKPNVISCTKDGVITGVSAGGYADITCKAKWGKASDKIRVYCVEPIDKYVKSDFVGLVTSVYAQPGIGKTVTMHLNMTYIIRYMMSLLAALVRTGFFPLPISGNFISSPDLAGGKCEIRGKYNSYAYIIVETEDGKRDGFVKHTKLEAKTNMFLTLSAEDIDVWGNEYVNPNKKLTTPYKGAVKWTVSDKSVIDFNDKTGQIKGLKPGTATITATAGKEQKTCTVHSLYRWPQTWKTSTNQETHLYSAKGSGYEEAISMPKGRNFTVYGDNGTSDGWAYGVTTISGKEYWGYIPISHVSTKGTISQYNNMKTTSKDGKKVPWAWPVGDVKNGIVQAKKAKYISSPYGWRDTNPATHKGMDITNGVSSKLDFENCVDEYQVVSAFSGKVVYLNTNTTKVCGNCVAIRSNEVDPVTGKYFVAIYMHMKYAPIVDEGDSVCENQLLGYVGSTGNSDGSHLHFEVNNQNLSYEQKIYYEENPNKEMVFGCRINPLFFYMNYYYLPDDNQEKIVINPNCSAMKYRKPFWYGDDVKETKEP